jgi:hypothetical protein
VACLTVLQITKFVCYRIPRINSLPYVMMSCLKCLVSVTLKLLSIIDIVISHKTNIRPRSLAAWVLLGSVFMCVFFIVSRGYPYFRKLCISLALSLNSFEAHLQNCEKLLLALSHFAIRPSVHPSAWNDSAPTGWIFTKFYVWGFSESLSKLKFD